MTMRRITPMLPVRDLAASVDFYRRLGFEVERRDDHWGWASLRLDDCRLMLDRSIRAHSPAVSATVLYLYPDSVESYHRQVREAGVPVPDLELTFYGMREFRIEDPDGNRLWIGEPAAPPV